ncbi:MAG: response regulator transcription factor [Acidimicrobiaceae bacterium]|nr:response regulator transcription factor [Acidimicrobiia bacterium]MCY4493616.1 response regulator transcription factor [Acidimicrobiaceae bacterium]
MNRRAVRILVVDDEESFLEALRVGLQREGFQIDVARDGPQALAQFKKTTPDLVLLDVMLPGISGIDVCREIRSESGVPIIMVTAKSEEIDAVVGLEVGADDYVSKPYRLRELVARIRALLRRAALNGTSPVLGSDSDEPVLRVGGLHLDSERHEVAVDGAQVKLPLKEFHILALLMRNPGRVVTRDTFIDRVWGYDYVGDTKTLDVHIKRLRAKIEPDPNRPERIVTVRGVGYKLTARG